MRPTRIRAIVVLFKEGFSPYQIAVLLKCKTREVERILRKAL